MDIWNPGYSEFTYFWGEAPFSQWSKSTFTVHNETYSHAEQWMMAEKARLFNDMETLTLIMEADDPREQKKLGRLVKNFEASVWNTVARQRVYVGNYHKFTQNPDALEQLKTTKGTLLVEASPYDKVWGIGLTAFDARNKKSWQGTNWLGEVLTKLRENLFEGKNHFEV